MTHTRIETVYGPRPLGEWLMLARLPSYRRLNPLSRPRAMALFHRRLLRRLRR